MHKNKTLSYWRCLVFFCLFKSFNLELALQPQAFLTVLSSIISKLLTNSIRVE